MSTFNNTVRTRRKTRLATALALALGLGAAQVFGADSATSSPAAHTALEVGRAATGLTAGDDTISVLIRSAATGDLGNPFTQAVARLKAAQTASATGAVIIVTNCNDSGPGSLREAVSNAMSGDTVDLSGIDCTGGIKLASSIVTTVDDLTIKGNPVRKYDINGQNSVRPITHAGTGTLTLDGVAVSDGAVTSATQTTLGGCIYSNGDIYLVNSRVRQCHATNTNTSTSVNSFARGGGVYAKGTLTVVNSSITSSTAKSDSSRAVGGNIYADKVVIANSIISGGTANGGIVSLGGGIFAKTGFMGKYANISGNQANGGNFANGGGVWVGSGEHIQLKYSTVSDNTARGAAGLAIGYLANDGDALTIQSSTIANNHSTATERHYGGAVFAGTDTVTIKNTTISGNTESNASDMKYGAGLRIKPGVTATLSSTVVAGNVLKLVGSDTTMPDDLTAANFTSDGSVKGTILGDHNFIAQRILTDVPSDTLGTDGLTPLNPMLGPLADNGGYTKTMRPKPGSPLIDAGNDNELTKDQRGSDFPRIVGPAADIGAVEANDIIFANGFD